MPYGMRIYNADGSIALDTNTFTYQIIHNQVISFAGVSSRLQVPVSIPGYAAANCCALLIPTQQDPGWDSFTQCAPYVISQDGGVIVQNYHPSDPAPYTLTSQTVRLLAIRYGL